MVFIVQLITKIYDNYENQDSKCPVINGVSEFIGRETETSVREIGFLYIIDSASGQNVKLFTFSNRSDRGLAQYRY